VVFFVRALKYIDFSANNMSLALQAQILKKSEKISRLKCYDVRDFLVFLILNYRRVNDAFTGRKKKWLGEITEIFLLLIALGIAVEILFGSPVPFIGGVVANLTGLLNTLGENGLVGLIALGIILYLFRRKRAVA